MDNECNIKGGLTMIKEFILMALFLVSNIISLILGRSMGRDEGYISGMSDACDIADEIIKKFEQDNKTANGAESLYNDLKSYFNG